MCSTVVSLLQDFVGLEPALGIPTTMTHSAARRWANAQQCKLWQTTSGCRQAKMFLHGPDKKLSRFAVSLPRRELKILVGLLTGHITLNCYEDSRRSIMLSMWRTSGDFIPLLAECCANMQIRYSIFGAHPMQPAELHKVNTSTLLWFARATKRFS